MLSANIVVDTFIPELSSQCPLQKTWNLNHCSLLNLFLADDFK